MPEDAAFNQPPSELKRDIWTILGELPFVGKWVTGYEKLSAGTQRRILFCLVVLVAYPILSFFIVMLALRLSPTSVQTGARNLILAALGVDDATIRQIDRSNQLVDAEVVESFGQDGTDYYYQKIDTSQDVKFEGIVRTAPAAQQPAGCANVSLDPDRQVGTLDVTAIGNAFQGRYPVLADSSTTRKIAAILAKQWQAQSGDARSDAERYVVLRLGFHPDPSLKDDPYFRCNQMRLWMTTTIFKPVLGAH